MKRVFERIPGYDCIATPCGVNGCGTNPGASHGRHCDEWLYVVQDGDVALSLSVYSGLYLDGVMSDPFTWPKGADLSLHVGFPIDRDQIAGRRGALDGIRPCRWVDGGRCYQGGGFSGCLVAHEFVERHFDKTRGPEDQDDGFWTALENKCREWGDEARKERVDTTFDRCMHCDGTGSVRKREER